jgi:hypothetical protein
VALNSVLEGPKQSRQEIGDAGHPAIVALIKNKARELATGRISAAGTCRTNQDSAGIGRG